jgi:hypothetical protein
MHIYVYMAVLCVYSWLFLHLYAVLYVSCLLRRLGIDWARLPRAAVRARQTRSFVYRVRVQDRRATAACSC